MKPSTPMLVTFDIHSNAEDAVSRWVDETLAILKGLSIKATFMIPAVFAEKISDCVRMVAKEGHEIGCHGLTHELDEAYYSLPYGKQRSILCEAKKRIEDVLSKEVVSFRAPAFKINGDTIKALEDGGFKADISVTSQRLGILSSEASNIGWLFSPRVPYHPDFDNPFRRGRSSVWEIPQSSLIFLFASNTGIALGKGFMKIFFKILHAESGIRNNPIVFMLHPEDLYPLDIKYKYKFEWNHLLPSKEHGFLLRYIFIHNRSGKEIAKQNIGLLNTMKSSKNIHFVTVKEMADMLDRKEARTNLQVPVRSSQSQ